MHQTLEEKIVELALELKKPERDAMYAAFLLNDMLRTIDTNVIVTVWDMQK
jgi:hypothetical protein